MKSIGFVLILLLFLIPNVYAQQGQMKLLAATESDIARTGTEADLFLQVEEGRGRVFLDTFPLTRMDTQISTRFAKQIACSFLDVDCSGLDFIYTIRSNSALIGGPSAGAALAVLTVALLDGQDVRQDIAITGTINSGGTIGPVGDVKEKIEIASTIGLKKVLIPRGTRPIGRLTLNMSTNVTPDVASLDLVAYGKELGVTVQEVSTLEEALLEFTGKHYRLDQKNIAINPQYENTMRELAERLCERSDHLRTTLEKRARSVPVQLENVENATDRGLNQFEKNQYYAAASFCFGANVRLTSLLLQLQELTEAEIRDKVHVTRLDVRDFDEIISNQNIKTITDLESYMAAKDRLLDARHSLDRSLETINETNVSVHHLAFAIERVNSANAWSTFFDHRNKEIALNENSLRNSCVDKLGEAEERYQYLRIAFPQSASLEDRQEITSAYEDYAKGEYALCLFRASKAKAAVNALINLIGITDERFDSVLGQKLGVARDILVREEAEGIFPILGYSYYEYANSLQDSDRFSSLLYSEYSLELSNLDIYFPQTRKRQPFIAKEQGLAAASFVGGVVVGIVGVLVAVVVRSRRVSLTRKSGKKKRVTKKGKKNSVKNKRSLKPSKKLR